MSTIYVKFKDSDGVQHEVSADYFMKNYCDGNI